MTNVKHRKKHIKTPKYNRVRIQSGQLMSILLRYKFIVFPIIISLPAKAQNSLYIARNKRELEKILGAYPRLWVSYFSESPTESKIDLSSSGDIWMDYQVFRKPRDGERLTDKEVFMWFLIVTGRLKPKAQKEPEIRKVRL